MKRIVICLLALFLIGCQENKPVSFEYREFFAMDTAMRIQLYDHGTEENFKKLETRVREIENTLSTTVKSSDIYKLNNNPEKILLNPDTYACLEAAKAMYDRTGGAFDPTIRPVVTLWNIGTESARVPAQAEIDDALKHVDGSKLQLQKEMKLPEGMKLELGAIAKGYTADELRKTAESLGIRNAIFNLGGNVLVMGSKNGQDFKVSIQDPNEEQNSFFCTVTGTDFTVVTSGDYERYFMVGDKRYHHILDPKTGYPSDNDLRSVSIVTKSSTLADGFSTSLFVMGLKDGLALAKKTPEIGVIFVTKDNRVIITDNLKDRFTLDNTNYKLIVGKENE
ncbi:FAD:protein FMN transferase [Guggenheimella bovis]